MPKPETGPEGPPTTEEAEEGKEEIPHKGWIRLDEDTEIRNIHNGETQTIRESSIVTTTTDKETYDVNNGIIAMVDKKGDYHVAPQTEERLESLRESGYEKGGCGVPFSNIWEPADPELKERWEKAKEQAREARKEDWE